MAHDDDKRDAGDDPWAGLDADGVTGPGGDLSFSFDEEPAGDAGGEGSGVGSEPHVVAFTGGGDDGAGGDGTDGDGTATAADDAAIDDWLSTTGGDDAAAPSSVLPMGTPDAPANEADLLDFASAESSVDIGTGTSGIATPGSSDAFADSAGSGAGGEEPDPFAALTGGGEEPAEGDIFAAVGDAAGGETATAEAGDVFGGLAGAAAAGATRRPSAKPGRPAPGRRKKKPSVIGQLVGVVMGGLMAVPITMAILLWGFGKDPFKLAPLVPESIAFLMPAKFRPVGKPGPDAIDLAGAGGLDAAGGSQAPVEGIADLPSDADLAGAEPGSAPATGFQPAPVEPADEPRSMAAEPTDLAAADPFPAAGGRETVDDPLMDLLGEETAKTRPAPEPVPEPKPAPPPEPEPLDLTNLDSAVAAATAALEAAASLDDPADPTRRKLLAKWYRALAGYAEELVALESEATETGRPFGPAAERAEAVRGGLAGHPELLEALGPLSRDWIAYAKRSSDGLVMPATFGSARRIGPYWRSQMTLPAAQGKPALDVVVMTRTEPAVAPGDSVVVTGLAVDDDVVWAVEVRPAVAAAAFPGL